MLGNTGSAKENEQTCFYPDRDKSSFSSNLLPEMKDLLQYPTDYWSKIEQNIFSKLQNSKNKNKQLYIVIVAHWFW